ncbi:30S ribosomal protein S20 [Picochlorum sp. SENEW3]|nr:30S ribosomal protein S20 [Picochlorum sp. SENEW3]
MAVASVISSFGTLRLSRPQAGTPRPQVVSGGFSSALAGQKINAVSRVSPVAATGRLTIEAKQNSLKRQRTTERNRMYNKSRKSEIATRMKKVFTALEEFKGNPPKSESDLEPVSTLMSEAYQVIDKAVVKGILHRNTAARRKARLAKARQYVLVEAGLYTPAE